MSHFFFYLCASLSVTGDVGRGKDKVRFPASQTSEVQKAVGQEIKKMSAKGEERKFRELMGKLSIQPGAMGCNERQHLS